MRPAHTISRLAALAAMLAATLGACGPAEGDSASREETPAEPAPLTEEETPEAAGREPETIAQEPEEASLESRCFRGERAACDQLGH